MQRFWGVTALVAGLVVALGACSGSDDAGAAAPSSGGSSGAAPSASAAPVATQSPGATAAPLPVLASRSSKIDGTPLAVDINQLQVQGRVTTLTFTLRSQAPDGAGRFQIASNLSDGIYQADSSLLAGDSSSVDGVYLLDPAGAKRYLAARTANKTCVCSGDLSSTFVGPGDAVVLSSTFAALPADATTVSVVVPSFGSLDRIPVSR